MAVGRRYPHSGRPCSVTAYALAKPYRLASVGPKSPTTGTPTAAATRTGPVSPPTSTPPAAPIACSAAAVARSYRWAQQCRQIATDSGFLANGHHVFAIVQGSTFDDLRREAAESLAAK